jgi:hypothetical protein
VRDAALGIALLRAGWMSISDGHRGNRETHLREALFLEVEKFSRVDDPHDDMAATLFRYSE